MRTKLGFSAVFLAMLLSACAHKANAPSASASLPPMVIGSRGVVMPLSQAVTKIGYRPYIPRVDVLQFAVIPPLGGPDVPATRGLAIEYAADKNAMLLSEWPSQHFPVTFSGINIVMRPCVTARFDRASVAWSSHQGLVMTLQPDGLLPARTVVAEAHRLIAHGACR